MHLKRQTYFDDITVLLFRGERAAEIHDLS
jgi:hypothetical protein